MFVGLNTQDPWQEQEEEEEAERAGRDTDTEPKTRTPHKDVGKNKQALVADALVFPKNQP